MLADAEAAGRDPFTVRDAYNQEHQLSVAAARRMLQGFNGMVDFWNGKSAAERSAYIKDNYLSGSTHQPWQNMTMARLVKILNRTKHNKYPRIHCKERRYRFH